MVLPAQVQGPPLLEEPVSHGGVRVEPEPSDPAITFDPGLDPGMGPDRPGASAAGSGQGARGSGYGTAGSEYGAAGSEYGAAGSEYGTAGSEYGTDVGYSGRPLPLTSYATRHVPSPEEAALTGAMHPATDRVMTYLIAWVMMALVGGGLLAGRDRDGRLGQRLEP
jgi:hypothetical protein